MARSDGERLTGGLPPAAPHSYPNLPELQERIRFLFED
jgi:hypothetical protein